MAIGEMVAKVVEAGPDRPVADWTAHEYVDAAKRAGVYEGLVKTYARDHAERMRVVGKLQQPAPKRRRAILGRLLSKRRTQ